MQNEHSVIPYGIIVIFLLVVNDFQLGIQTSRLSQNKAGTLCTFFKINVEILLGI